jgi:acyl CoA:acetate/3-ketoacid CoA transferase alpha subunit/acyl CoA:acetate/3-ketoacid CoA transferase beta subunit
MKNIFQLDETLFEKQGKVTTLSEAIEKHIAPGMTIHLNTGSYPNALIREVIRQYWHTKPDFKLVTSGVTTPFEIAFTCSGLVRKVITTNHSYLYPIPKPISLLRKMYQDGEIEIESWSLHTLQQRLMAAAEGVGFLPTKSLMDTSLGEENGSAYKIISDPFDSDRKIGAVKALAPDVSLIHGCVADPDGNVILPPPYFASIWGPRASRKGVIVSVEKIVSREFIRQHNALVKLPASLVTCVCPVPLGSHPQGLAAKSIGMDDGYGEDYPFVAEAVTGSRDASQLEEWLHKWVIECGGNRGYLEKLGKKRISFLKNSSSVESSESDITLVIPEKDEPPTFNAIERMVVSAAREIKTRVIENHQKTILAGIGASGLAAWLAYYLLKNEGRHVDLVTGAGLVGFAPRPGDPFLLSLPNVMTSTMLTDAVEIYGTLVGGAYNRCLSVLGTAQIDMFGNINTVKIGDSPLIGVGGAGDAVNARECLVVVKQAKDRFFEKLAYIGCSGKNIKTLVTDLGVYQKIDKEDSFTLTKVIADGTGVVKEDEVNKIKEKCGWPLKTADKLVGISPPEVDELAVLRALDPERLFIGK